MSPVPGRAATLVALLTALAAAGPAPAAALVRPARAIPVHPVAWRARGPQAYLALLDQEEGP
jgi:hypothetical protein